MFKRHSFEPWFRECLWLHWRRQPGTTQSSYYSTSALISPHMMASSSGNICLVIGLLLGQWRGATNGWANNRDAGDLRRHRAHYDVIVMKHSTADVRRRICQWQIDSRVVDFPTSLEHTLLKDCNATSALRNMVKVICNLNRYWHSWWLYIRLFHKRATKVYA